MADDVLRRQCLSGHQNNENSACTGSAGSQFVLCHVRSPGMVGTTVRAAHNPIRPAIPKDHFEAGCVADEF